MDEAAFNMKILGKFPTHIRLANRCNGIELQQYHVIRSVGTHCSLYHLKKC